MTLVSVCIPVYHRPHEVARAVRSVLAQTYTDLELVVVDNASTDSTWSTLRDLAATDDRIRIFRNEVTVNRVRNWRKCVELARGEYVKLLFSDDWIAPDSISAAVPALADDVGFVYSAMTWHYDVPAVCYREPRSGPVRSIDFLVRSATVEDRVPVSTSCTLTRRADLLKAFTETIPARLPFALPHGLGHDGILLWRIAADYPSVYHLAEELAHSADPHAGEPNTRTRIGPDGQQRMWWAYRNAFAFFLTRAHLPAPTRRALAAALFLSCVPLRPTRTAAEHLGLFRRLFPASYRWWAMSPIAVLPLLRHRLREPLDPTIPL